MRSMVHARPKANPQRSDPRQRAPQAPITGNLIAKSLPEDFEAAYQAIASDPKYSHFVNIPARIIRCLDYFGIAGDRELIRGRLQSYYLFIGVVDNAIDSGQIGIGARVLNCLHTQVPMFDGNSRDCRVKLITEVLKHHISDDCYPLIIDKFAELYQEVLRERAARSIDAYIDRRRTIGFLTAELSYLLICPLLKSNGVEMCNFMKEVGAVGCLVDSIIDLRSDHRLGLLGFEPALSNYAKLMVLTMRLGLRLVVSYPGLGRIFFEAIVDNFRDRISRDQLSHGRGMVSDRKDQATGVA